jgi:hypothetical protein
MDIAAFVFAAVSLAVSVFSVGWQVAVWLFDAGRVRVVLRHGLLTRSAAITSKVVGTRRGGLFAPSRKPGRGISDLDSIRSQGLDGPEVLAIAVTNTGRVPVTVAKYGTKLAEAAELSPHADHLGPALPFRLEPGTTETWFVKMDAVRRFVHAGQVLKEGARDVTMFAELGSGKTVITRDRLRVDAGR